MVNKTVMECMSMESETLSEMRASLIKHFLDVVISKELRKSGSMSGYDIIRHIHGTHDIPISPGTVYSLLYSLERRKIVDGKWSDRKRVYSLTKKGEKAIDEILHSKEELLKLVELLFENQ
jgi:DNA-binding PadR family transcriptional regulator